MSRLIFTIRPSLLFCLALTAQSMAQVSFTGTELLGRPTDHSITLNVVSSSALDAYIEYGASSGVYSNATSTVSKAANEPIVIVINGLSANTKYYYRLRYRVSGSGSSFSARDEHTFHTQRPAGSTFTFTVVSDSHLGQYGGQTQNQKALYQQTLLNIVSDHPDFHLDLGDTFPMDPQPLGTGMTEVEAKTAYLTQRPYMGLIGSSVPIFLVLGNHENEEGWNFDDTFTPPDGTLALRGLEQRKLYYPNPVPNNFYSGNMDPLPSPIGGDSFREDYYAWEWGDALFVVIDPFQYSMIWPSEGDPYGGEGADGEVQGDRWDWTLGTQQYQWLRSTLENSNAKFKFVLSHQVTGGVIPYGRGGVAAAPYFEWGGLNWNGTPGFETERPGWEMPIHQLMVENGVTVFFHGHDHFFAKEELDGIVYQECPKPDDDSYGMGFYTSSSYPTGVSLSNSGHIRVTVSPSQMIVDYIRSSKSSSGGSNGEVRYSYTIQAPSITVNTKIFLQGSYNGSSMNTALNSYLPTSHPYDSSPWNYSGAESVTTLPSGVVDWVLVELRKTYNGASVGRKAAFIKNDGTIVDLDGSSLVVFSGITAGYYHIVIRHRNHLAVMSANAVALASSSSLYDFTTAQTQAYGTNAMKDLGDGAFAMYAGDANGNGQVQNDDKNDYWQVQVGTAGYKSADFNLNGQVQNDDKNDYWQFNVGRGTQVP